jgi:hypothetical protein
VSADALTPNAILHIEVQMPAIVHTVPLSAVERWMHTPNTSPKEEIAKRESQNAEARHR